MSPTFFEALGVRPLLGRIPTAAEHQQGQNLVVVLRWGYWKRRFAADPDIIGKTVQINGLGHTVVGVMPPSSPIRWQPRCGCRWPRIAARIYGAQPFEEGLRHVVRRQIEFKHFAGKEIQEALKSRRALQNIYGLEMQPEKTVEDAIDTALNRQTSEDDTHPSPVDRFRLVSRVVCQNQPAPSGLMWDLFADREAITKEMSSEIEKMVKAAVA